MPEAMAAASMIASGMHAAMHRGSVRCALRGLGGVLPRCVCGAGAGRAWERAVVARTPAV